MNEWKDAGQKQRWLIKNAEVIYIPSTELWACVDDGYFLGAYTEFDPKKDCSVGDSFILNDRLCERTK